VKDVHVPSGTGELPNRTDIASADPDGTLDVQNMEAHVRVELPSSTRDVKLPEAAYGVSRNQSRDKTPSPTVKSLAMGRMFVEIVTL
jgi:hypothetical protein